MCVGRLDACYLQKKGPYDMYSIELADIPFELVMLHSLDEGSDVLSKSLSDDGSDGGRTFSFVRRGSSFKFQWKSHHVRE